MSGAIVSGVTATARGTRVAALTDLTPELGVAALIGGTPVAVFRLLDDRVFAVQNLCPFSGASVLSRGITGSRGDVPTIASPMYKQVFSLFDGSCLDTMGQEPRAGLDADLATFAVAVVDGDVWIAGPGRGDTSP